MGHFDNVDHSVSVTTLDYDFCINHLVVDSTNHFSGFMFHVSCLVCKNILECLEYEKYKYELWKFYLFCN